MTEKLNREREMDVISDDVRGQRSFCGEHRERERQTWKRLNIDGKHIIFAFRPLPAFTFSTLFPFSFFKKHRRPRHTHTLHTEDFETLGDTE
ncbi:hypothetical protein L1987_76933 [Smallanthus sonchifolius]|uniref:Uncharacterized protein n=1 Tax=Smallanthus sonchifolius TaxID=185202 RepID=A0ACB8Z910_9ASTR|nr:hypothetical protein L1987_76933 [Smallanthus sonchifolius]